MPNFSLPPRGPDGVFSACIGATPSRAETIGAAPALHSRPGMDIAFESSHGVIVFFLGMLVTALIARSARRPEAEPFASPEPAADDRPHPIGSNGRNGDATAIRTPLRLYRRSTQIDIGGAQSPLRPHVPHLQFVWSYGLIADGRPILLPCLHASRPTHILAKKPAFGAAAAAAAGAPGTAGTGATGTAGTWAAARPAAIRIPPAATLVFHTHFAVMSRPPGDCARLPDVGPGR